MPKTTERRSPLAHNDDGFLRPDAWDEAKRAFGVNGDVAQMLERLEQCSIANPRILLAAAIHEFLRAEESDRRHAVEQYLRLPHAVCAPTSPENAKHFTPLPKAKQKSTNRKRSRR